MILVLKKYFPSILFLLKESLIIHTELRQIPIEIFDIRNLFSVINFVASIEATHKTNITTWPMQVPFKELQKFFRTSCFQNISFFAREITIIYKRSQSGHSFLLVLSF